MDKEIHDFYIKYPQHPRYLEDEIEEENSVEVLINQLEVLLFTNRGEVFGLPDFGANIPYWLWKTNVSAQVIEDDIRNQISKWIPDLDVVGYTLRVEIQQGTVQDIGLITITVGEKEIEAIYR